MAILVDTGPLYALADSSDRHHRAVTDLLERIGETLVVPISVLPELCYLLNRELGSEAEAGVVRSLAAGEGGLRVESLTRADLVSAADLLRRYSDAKVGFVDASLVAVAERLEIRKVLTIDRRHFSMFRPRHCDAFEILP